MRLFPGFVIGTLLAAAASAGTPEKYQFSFHMLVDGGSPVTVSADVTPGSVRSFEVTPELRLEIELPASVSRDSPIVVKLVREAKSVRSTLYEGRSIAPMPTERVLVYKVCNNVTTFSEELPKGGLRCEPAQ
jgi:hypothetical protein